jgi:thiol:disulfide interchange protein
MGGEPDNAGPSFGAADGVLGQGDRIPKLEAGFTSPGPDRAAQLFVSATLPPGANTYSITQRPGGVVRTTIKLDAAAEGPVIGEFVAVTPAEVKFDNDAYPGLPLEEHFGKVKWVAPIQFAPGVRPESVVINGKVKMQLCDKNGCVQPTDYPFSATLRPDVAAVKVGSPAPPRPSGVAAPPGPATSASVARANAAATAAAALPPSVLPSPSGSPSPGGAKANPLEPAANAAPPTVTAPTGIAPPSLNLAKSPAAGSARGVTGEGEIAWLPFTNVSELREMVGPGFDVEQIRENVRKDAADLGIAGAIFAGLVGGLIFNIMPCVLPVVGLKILSFVEQAGHNRRKSFMLNVWYSAGLLAVFLLLASLAVGPQHLGWGELFGKAWFTITLTAVVFVMALSFMGVWEVPLPTFLGSGKTGALAAQEGAVGAFFKGILTTFLATPCGAPLFAPALVWATAQPPWLTYAVFLSAGLGMASPYLLVGAFPELLRFLPKPGAWMETFKIFMGFVLMGTVVYLLAVLKIEYVVPTVGLLFGLSFMCWWCGRIAPVADVMVKLRAWALGSAVVCLGFFRFSGLAAVMAKKCAPVPMAAAKGSASGVVGPKTVLVAFTADWCPTCHYYENTVLNSDAVIESLRRLGVVTVKADWSQDSPEVSGMLDVLNSKQIPVIAIFSAQDPNHPSVFHAGYTQEEILRALQKAGPSPGAGGLVQAL